MKTVNIEKEFKTVSNFWDPKTIGELNSQSVKIARFNGDFVRHKHDNEDELFYLIEGSLKIELDDKTIELEKGEFTIIPKGVYHKPIADKECKVLLFEPNTTVRTGDK